MANLRHFTWQMYDEAIGHLLAFLKARSFQPDLIVGIARGGLIPMATLSHKLGTRSVGVLLLDKTASDERYANASGKQVQVDGSVFRVPPAGTLRRILLVDDITAWGDTLRTARAILQERFGSEIEVVTMSLVYRNVCTDAERGTGRDAARLLDSHWLEVTADTWTVFPWE